MYAKTLFACTALFAAATALPSLPYPYDQTTCAVWLYQDAAKGNGAAQVESNTYFLTPGTGVTDCIHGFYDASKIKQQTSSIERFGSCECSFYKNTGCTGDEHLDMDKDNTYIAHVGTGWNDAIHGYKCKAV